VQLSILALTDVMVSMFWAVGFIVRLLMESDLIAKDINTFNHLAYYFDFIAPINRVFTLYIAFNRARIVGCFSQGELHDQGNNVKI
jgi:hypothetical protein